MKLCVRVTAMQKQIKEGHGQLEELWESRRARLELCLQLRIYEQHSLEVRIVLLSNAHI